MIGMFVPDFWPNILFFFLCEYYGDSHRITYDRQKTLAFSIEMAVHMIHMLE